MTFEALNIVEPILKALRAEGYTEPTPVQVQSVPPVLKGCDLLACAQTGTGKTAAFAVPILQRLSAKKEHKAEQSGGENRRKIRALVLTPTRELALQIFDSFRAYGRYLRLRCCVIFGGVNQDSQVEALKKGVDILVATPGRLNDLISQGFIHLEQVEIFVLDEADRMLDMGFIHDVEKIIGHMPQKKQTLLFSATVPPEIQNIADKVLRADRSVIEVTPSATTVEAIDQQVYYVDRRNKIKLLIHLLKNKEIVSALVFTRTKHGADRVARQLQKAEIPAYSIHGDKSQGARQAALNAFKKRNVRVLVATDIAARGIDIEELSHVFNFDIPEVPETYVHRIGRTGRAGQTGTAISFCEINEEADLKTIEKTIGKTIPAVEGHPYPMQETTAVSKAELQRQRRERAAAYAERDRQAKQRKMGEKSMKNRKNDAVKKQQSPGKPKAVEPAKKADVKALNPVEKPLPEKLPSPKNQTNQPKKNKQKTVPNHRAQRPKPYEYKDRSRMKDDIVTYTPDWGSSLGSVRQDGRKKPEDQALTGLSGNFRNKI